MGRFFLLLDSLITLFLMLVLMSIFGRNLYSGTDTADVVAYLTENFSEVLDTVMWRLLAMSISGMVFALFVVRFSINYKAIQSDAQGTSWITQTYKAMGLIAFVIVQVILTCSVAVYILLWVGNPENINYEPRFTLALLALGVNTFLTPQIFGIDMKKNTVGLLLSFDPKRRSDYFDNIESRPD